MNRRLQFLQDVILKNDYCRTDSVMKYLYGMMYGTKKMIGLLEQVEDASGFLLKTVIYY